MSTRQLNVHSQVVMLDVANPREDCHHSVIICRQVSLRRKMPSYRMGKLGLMDSLSFRVNCRSILIAVLFGACWPGSARSGLRYQWASRRASRHNSFQICPLVSDRLNPSQTESFAPIAKDAADRQFQGKSVCGVKLAFDKQTNGVTARDWACPRACLGCKHRTATTLRSFQYSVNASTRWWRYNSVGFPIASAFTMSSLRPQSSSPTHVSCPR